MFSHFLQKSWKNGWCTMDFNFLFENWSFAMIKFPMVNRTSARDRYISLATELSVINILGLRFECNRVHHAFPLAEPVVRSTMQRERLACKTNQNYVHVYAILAGFFRMICCALHGWTLADPIGYGLKMGNFCFVRFPDGCSAARAASVGGRLRK